MKMLEAGIDIRAMVHITGGGLTNLTRVQTDNIRFVIDPLPEPLPVYELIQEIGGRRSAESAMQRCTKCSTWAPASA
jgi:phosphoribosylformylglycinamidine cyclo-ligase